MTARTQHPGGDADFYCNQVFTGLAQVVTVAETDRVLAFEHTRPTHPVHIVVVPKVHVPSLVDLGEPGEELLTDVLRIVRAVAAVVQQRTGACRVVTNLGAYQDSQHLHFHVLSHLVPDPDGCWHSEISATT